MQTTTPTLVKYETKVKQILGTILDPNIGEAAALSRFPVAKGNIAKLVDTLLKAKENTNDAIFHSEIDEIVKEAEEGLKQFGQMYFSGNRPVPQQAQPVAQPSPCNFYQEENVEQEPMEEVPAKGRAMSFVSNPVFNSNKVTPNEKYHVLVKGLPVFDTKEDLIHYLQANHSINSMPMVIKGTQVKVSFGIDIME